MILKKENSIYIASTTWGWTDDTLIAAIFGFLPPDKETRLITGSESRILWSKTKVDNDTYYSAIDASVRLHKINDDLDFTVTNYGDIIIYRTSGCSYTPQEVIDSYNRYIGSGFFVREEKKEDKKMVIEANKYIYISTNTSACSDDRLIEALLGYVPFNAQHKNISPYDINNSGILWSRTKLSEEYWFYELEARARLRELNGKLDFVKTAKGDIIIFRDINDEVSKIFEVYNRIISQENKEDKKEDLKMIIEANNYIYIASNTTDSSDSQLISALFGYVPICTKYETIHGCALLWSRTKFLHERSFDSIDAHKRLKELDEKLSFVMTEKGDVIIYRDIVSDKSKILSAYYEYSKKDEPHMVDSKKYVYDRNCRLNVDSHVSLNCQHILTMPRNLGRTAAMSMLNSIYGLNPTEGLLNWNDWSNIFKLYFGVERATGKQKTVCIWKDGEKTIIRGDKSVLSMPVQYAVAWCYVKRRFKTTSQFKKYVDNHSYILDGITYFEGDARAKMAQASVNNRTKKYDIYDAAALAITAKHYGSVKTIMNYCDGWGE